MQPNQTLSVDEIMLSELDFWELPLTEREGAFLTLRMEKPLGFFVEPDTTAAGIEPGPGYWAVTKYQDILDVSRQPELFCSGKGATSIADMPEFMNDFFGSMINMDDPRHARMRKIVAGAFTPRMLKKVEDDIARIAAEVVDDIVINGTGDFVIDVAARLPLKVICEMMGIGEGDYDTIFSRSNTILGSSDPEYVAQEDPMKIIEALLTAGGELHQIVADLGKYRREHPADDLTSALVNANVDGEQLTDQELGSFFILLVVAGNETTRNAIAHALHLLTTNEDQRSLLASDYPAYGQGAVEEIVRVASPVLWMRRTATQNTQLRGEEIAAGDKLVLFYWSANRDAEVFSDPFTFDIRRSPNPHVGFGGPGPHFCLGAHLARREVGVMMRELFTRVPAIRSTAEPDRLRSSFINGIKHLSYSL